jgi:hypothetical protein
MKKWWRWNCRIKTSFLCETRYELIIISFNLFFSSHFLFLLKFNLFKEMRWVWTRWTSQRCLKTRFLYWVKFFTVRYVWWKTYEDEDDFTNWFYLKLNFNSSLILAKNTERREEDFQLKLKLILIRWNWMLHNMQWCTWKWN